MRTLVFGETQFDRLSIPENLRYLSNWPTVDSTAISEKYRAKFIANCEAIRLLIEEEHISLVRIREMTGIHPKTLYQLVRRCWSKHDDGRINGFRGAIPYARIKEYERIQPVSSNPNSKGGLSGAFTLLLQTHPSLKKLISRAANQRKKKNPSQREARYSLKRLHKAFLQQCRAVGIKPNQYPFTQELLGIRSLAAHLRKLSTQTFEKAASKAGAKHIGAPASNIADSAPAATRAFEVVEFDGHKIDLRITVRVDDPYGMEQLMELHRIWILVLLDVASRAIIGYSLALGKEYNKDDVAEALQAALTPHRSRTYKIPGLSVRNGGGYPSEVIPATEYACWDWFRFDGARAHLAHDTLDRLIQVVGCWPDNGPPGEPDERPFIERFFSLLAEHFAHRLPGTTGNNPDAIEKILNDPGSDISLLVELDEMEEMIEVLIADYNGESHGGLGGRTPLEAMVHLVNKQQGFIRTLPKRMRADLCLLQEARELPVRGSIKNGVRPHINFYGVRYTCDVLSNNPSLIGKKVRIYFDVRDIRSVRAFFNDGAELGILTAARPWCYTPHSLRVRQEILRLIRTKKLQYREGEDPVQAWRKYRHAQGKNNKRAANDLAIANRQERSVREQEPAFERPPEPPIEKKPEVVDSASLPLVENPAEQAPQPHALTIKRTITF